jgi:benzoate transport
MSPHTDSKDAELDPRATIAREPLHARQILAIALAMTFTAIDGFDVFSISFASPGIAGQWGIDKAELGVVLSMELIGMGIGSILLGAMADRAGRRPIILACLTIMATGMWLASLAVDVLTLSLVRLYTGLGIGGLLAAGNAVVAECANDRRRDLTIALTISGYPLGAVIGGAIASEILATTGRWQAIFEFGAFATAALIIPAVFLVPETIAFLCHRQPKNALHRVNRILAQQGRRPVTALPPMREADDRSGVKQLFEAGLASNTVALTLAYFMHIGTFYFLMKWIPKLVADMGYPPQAAAEVLVWANVGGAAGSIAVSLLTQRYPVRALVIGAMVCGSAAVTAFGQGLTSLTMLSAIAAVAGLFTTGATAGLYALFAQAFPTSLRASGTGFVIGIGRGGAALGPIVAGLLFSAGWPLSWVAPVMACGCLVAAVALSSTSFRLSSIPQTRRTGSY